MNRIRVFVLLAVALGIAATTAEADAQAPATCTLRLLVQLSGEVENSQDPAFLSSLAGTPGFVLTWISASKPDMTVTLKLTGQGSDYACRQEVERIRNDARVNELTVLDPSSHLHVRRAPVAA
jgi:hypothetical protein